MTLPRRIWNVSTIMLLLLFLLSARLVYWQVVRDELEAPIFRPIGSAETSDIRLIKNLDFETLQNFSELPQPAQQRAAAMLANIERGAILDRNGRPLAFDAQSDDGQLFRFYTEPSMAPVLGYTSAFRLGLTGAEQAFNETLLGLDRFDADLSQLIHTPIQGNDIFLTLDSHVQRVAVDALGGRAGAVVVLDGVSGEVLAMASTPTFDPNRILEQEYAASLGDCPQQPCASPLINRATQGLYTPGSIWKTVTLLTALDSGLVNRDTVFDFGEPRRGPGGIYYVYHVDGAEIIDPNHDERQLNLTLSYAFSANAAFARMGNELDPQTYINYATRLGFGEGAGPTPLEIETAETQLAADLQELINNNVLQAATGFGQGELLVTPLSMATMLTSVVNQGDLVQPHLLMRIQSPSGNVREEVTRELWQEGVISPDTAQTAVDIMVESGRRASGAANALPGMTVGGKTGTAQLGGDLPPHAWYTGFVHNGERTVVVSVVVEYGGEGAAVAVPIFARVAAAALNELGEPVQEVIPAP
jgi:peptidoglycan glycosyltransferase